MFIYQGKTVATAPLLEKQREQNRIKTVGNTADTFSQQKLAEGYIINDKGLLVKETKLGDSYRGNW